MGLSSCSAFDATKKGWVGIVLDASGAYVAAVARATIVASVEAAGPLAVVGVDMAIGLPDAGAREAAAKARKMLGGRHS